MEDVAEQQAHGDGKVRLSAHRCAAGGGLTPTSVYRTIGTHSARVAVLELDSTR
jgi:hypothetical protein